MGRIKRRLEIGKVDDILFAPNGEDKLEMWWEALDEYTMEEIEEYQLQSKRYLGKANLLLIDLEDLKNDNTNGIRFKKQVPFDEIESLKPWIGDEIKRFNGEYEKKDDMSHLSLHRYMNPKMILVMLFASIEEGYDFVTTLTLEKDVIFENLKTDCDECLDEVAFSDSELKDDDDWVRLCLECSMGF